MIVPPERYDVFVYAATASGVMAAIAASEEGATALIVEPGRHIGGMVSGGLSYTDEGHHSVHGGLAGKFLRAVEARYGRRYAGPEPNVAEALLRKMLLQANVSVVFDEALKSVDKAGHRIAGVETESGRTFRAAVFIDASYEGDLLALAGVPFAVGREDRSLYNEVFAGRREWNPGKHNFNRLLSGVDHHGRLLPGIRDTDLVPVGAGDHGLMAYGYRVILTRDPSRWQPFPKPADYSSRQYELLARYLGYEGAHLGLHDLVGLAENLANNKVDANSLGPVSLNVLDGSYWEYPVASRQKRRLIAESILNYTQGFFYFLAHDPAVPAHIRAQTQVWGLPADEFEDTDHWPHQLYVREARRMLGQYVLTEGDIYPRPRHQPDSVLMGSYHIDIREVQRVTRWVYEHPVPLRTVWNEGYLSVPVLPYQLPYRCLVPRGQDCTNLIVPVCISASHVAFASYRMEIQYMMAGEAAGVAASHACRDCVPVQSIDLDFLQKSLRSRQQVIAL